MPELTVTNLTRSPLPTQDSFGSLGPSETRTKNLSVAQVEKIRPLLIVLENQGIITWNVGGYLQTDGDAEFVTFEDASALGGPTLRQSTFVVGNSPAGDLAADVDFLDPGDGTGIASAVAALSLLPEGGEIFIRRGTYNADLSGTSFINVSNNMSLRGEGDSTVINIDSEFRNLFTFVGTRSSISDLRITGGAPVAAALGSYVVDFGASSICSMSRVKFDFTTSNGNESLVAFIGGFGATNVNITDLDISSGTGWPATFVGILPNFFIGSLNRILFTMASGTAAIDMSGQLLTLTNCGGNVPAAFGSGLLTGPADNITIQSGSWLCTGTSQLQSTNNVNMNGVTIQKVGFAPVTAFLLNGCNTSAITGNSFIGTFFANWTVGVEINATCFRTLLASNFLPPLPSTAFVDAGTQSVITANFP